MQPGQRHARGPRLPYASARVELRGTKVVANTSGSKRSWVRCTRSNDGQIGGNRQTRGLGVGHETERHTVVDRKDGGWSCWLRQDGRGRGKAALLRKVAGGAQVGREAQSMLGQGIGKPLDAPAHRSDLQRAADEADTTMTEGQQVFSRETAAQVVIRMNGVVHTQG